MANEDQIGTVLRLLEHDPDHLAAMIANNDDVIVFGSAKPPPESDVNFGWALFEDKLSGLSRTLCSDPRVVDFLDREARFDEVTVVAAVLDIVVTKTGGVPVLAFTAMVLKYGLKRVCLSDG